MEKYTTISAKTDPECVSIDEARTTLGFLEGDKDSEILAALNAVVEVVEAESHRVLRVGYTVAEVYPKFPCNPVRFDWQPVKSIDSITYYDSDGTSQTVSSSSYRLLTETNGASVLEWDDDYTWPTVDVRRDAVTINYTAGYASLAVVPDAGKFAIRLKLREVFGDLTEREFLANNASYKALLNQIQWGAYR